MNNPTRAARPFHGQALMFVAAAAMLGLPSGPGTSVQVDSLARAFSRGAAAAPRAPAAYVESSQALPPFPRESAGAPPGRDYRWVPGYYRWTAVRGGYHWVWFKGHYEYPPRAGAQWMAPHFEDCGNTRIYVGGYWRIP